MALAYEDSGQGPAVVLLHAFPLDRTLWKAQKDALSARYRVIAPDLPGHGQSPRLAGAPTIDGMADEVATLLDRPVDRRNDSEALRRVDPIVAAGARLRARTGDAGDRSRVGRLLAACAG